jgi:hypothetical protein
MIEESRRSLYRTLAIVALGIAVLVAIIVLMFSLRAARMASQYQAVFLTNGQVYFGHITHRGWKTIRVEDVYYLQVKSASSTASSDDLSLIKMGNELHGPEDGLEVNWNQILFIESLRNDSRVVSAIENYRRR